jgi:hypothetical protein
LPVDEDWIGESIRPADLRFGLEAAVAVIYARPFKSRKPRGLDRDEWKPDDDAGARWHDELIDLRDTLYAHTDDYDASGRRIREPDESEPPGGFTEEWLGWEPGDDASVEALLVRQRQHLAVLAEAAQRRLRHADHLLATLVEGSAG